MKEKFISCDWGTSNFRIRLVDLTSLEVLKELVSNDGVKFLYKKFALKGKVDQHSFYLNFLKNKIELLNLNNGNYSIVCSGMASSSLGLKDLPYANFPFDFSGSSLKIETFKFSAQQNLHLISGIKNDHGMMRGEEVQAIGLEKYLEDIPSGTLVLPGTHSKHISFKNGSFTNLSNYMTGELFDVLSKDSILSSSVSNHTFDKKLKESFLEGVNAIKNRSLSSSLFNVRARQILQQKNKKKNSAYLSGLLIGDELKTFETKNNYIVLAAPKSLIAQYKLALKSMVEPKRIIILNPEILETALLTGHRKILNLYEH
ncbi:2-dehydro-3-deoxygalactonokinase [Cytophaga sp. FL35]|uniref:2-dehydro-3-deoxygalactonokinase n=1 Tax=Cytophaga sp. FL35 TaxID=1904456 RepID=UPI0016535955|nr:2-dehydro-3-deoxygalactonokinase [Cytophaga sp. FL35]MBC6998032.1 2-dehydro-3-deoxygalactonokinase [Cytophaga sp. FL35]